MLAALLAKVRAPLLVLGAVEAPGRAAEDARHALAGAARVQVPRQGVHGLKAAGALEVVLVAGRRRPDVGHELMPRRAAAAAASSGACRTRRRRTRPRRASARRRPRAAAAGRRHRIVRSARRRPRAAAGRRRRIVRRSRVAAAAVRAVARAGRRAGRSRVACGGLLPCRVACALARLLSCPLPRRSRLLCLLPLARPRHGDSCEKGERSVCVSSLRQHAASGRAAGRPRSCRRSSFPVGGTALTRRARARRAWWAHLRRGGTDGCGHIGRSLLFGHQKPWSLSQNLRSSNLISVADPSCFWMRTQL